MDSAKLWRTLKSSPTYGRLSKDSHTLDSIPTGLPDLTIKPPTASSSSNGGQNSLLPSQLISDKAKARNISAEKLQVVYKEKQKLVKNHFSDQSKEWQHWFVEATAWGHLCMPNSKFDLNALY
jgi:hypothetical protein